ncbi:MAG: cell wall-binding repeat-containing protein, partial [Finegoldia magna]|nr:cell wall-binding repeat-containing protein [Finegoldia magna]
MNKKIIAGLMITATFLSTTSLASNESKKLETMKNFDLKIDEQIDKKNLKDEIVLQNGVRLKFDQKRNLIEYDALNSTAKIRTRSVDVKFEDYLNSTISKLQKDDYIPKEYKL